MPDWVDLRASAWKLILSCLFRSSFANQAQEAGHGCAAQWREEHSPAPRSSVHTTPIRSPLHRWQTLRRPFAAISLVGMRDAVGNFARLSDTGHRTSLESRILGNVRPVPDVGIRIVEQVDGVVHGR